MIIRAKEVISGATVLYEGQDGIYQSIPLTPRPETTYPDVPFEIISL